MSRQSEYPANPTAAIRSRIEAASKAMRKRSSMSVPIMNRPGERLTMRPVPIINKVSASRFIEKTNLDFPPGFADRDGVFGACYRLTHT